MEGNRAEDIAQALANRFPNEDPAKLLSHAADHFATVAEADPLVVRGFCLEALRELYRRCFDIGDYQGALKAVKELMAYAKGCSSPPPPEEPQSLEAPEAA